MSEVPSTSLVPSGHAQHSAQQSGTRPRNDEDFVRTPRYDAEGMDHLDAAAPTVVAKPQESTFRSSAGEPLARERGQAVVRRPKLRSSSTRFVALQQWEGTVTAVAHDEFEASARDLTVVASPMEQFTLETSDVSPRDRRLLVPGAVFYWSIGYEHAPTGQVQIVSRLVFQRLPLWTARDIVEARNEAQVMRRSLDAD